MALAPGETWWPQCPLSRGATTVSQGTLCMPAKASCNDCYFRREGLCAFPGETRARRSALSRPAASCCHLASRASCCGRPPHSWRRRLRRIAACRRNPRRRGRARRAPGRPGGSSSASIALYALIVVLANRHSVDVNFVFFKTSASLFVVLAARDRVRLRRRLALRRHPRSPPASHQPRRLRAKRR